MDIQDKMKMVEFLNIFGKRSGTFCIDPTNGEAAYAKGSRPLSIPDEGIRQLYSVVMENARLTQEVHRHDSKYREVFDDWLDGRLIEKYDNLTSDTQEDSE